ncbi:tetratricopeptide repeat protein 19, mitochondrial isoform X6 [Colius striatus]|nr:tetratricopeptide repeat protein 19, mitochondrial isoform X6 [Colius striatus]
MTMQSLRCPSSWPVSMLLRNSEFPAKSIFCFHLRFTVAVVAKQRFLPLKNTVPEEDMTRYHQHKGFSRHKLALAGYEFCILTLEEKIAKQKDLPEDVLPAEEKANTRLLLGMSLDSYARYLLNLNQLSVAQKMYEKALQISNDVQGETHPQTVVLMNDLATVLDAQGHYDEAYSYVKRAAELAKETQHPEEHMVLNNLAAILMHKEDFLQAKQVYKEALKQAQQKGDAASVQHIQEELAELAKRRKASK